MTEIKWTSSGNLIVEYEDGTMILVDFYDSYHTSKLTRLEKLELLTKIVEQALNNPNLTKG